MLPERVALSSHSEGCSLLSVHTLSKRTMVCSPTLRSNYDQSRSLTYIVRPVGSSSYSATRCDASKLMEIREILARCQKCSLGAGTTEYSAQLFTGRRFAPLFHQLLCGAR